MNHSKDEYARYDGERMISTNTVEGYYSIFKRGMKGVYIADTQEAEEEARLAVRCARLALAERRPCEYHSG